VYRFNLCGVLHLLSLNYGQFILWSVYFLNCMSQSEGNGGDVNW